MEPVSGQLACPQKRYFIYSDPVRQAVVVIRAHKNSPRSATLYSTRDRQIRYDKQKSIRVYPTQRVYGRFTDMKGINNLALALLTMVLCLPLHAAKVYKWQDADGAWHFSETPPAEQQAEVIKLKQASKSTDDTDQANANADSPGEEATVKKDRVSTNTEPKPAYTAEEKRTNCDLAKKRLGGLETHPRVLINDDKTGEERYLTPEEHQEWQAKSRQEISEFCE
ncbi:MAG: hypothetical protein COB19_08935 [Porticoccus sp.]|nr:MAG: hypothetical protein COB19_08935 [Porticoccus sp.]